MVMDGGRGHSPSPEP